MKHAYANLFIPFQWGCQWSHLCQNSDVCLNMKPPVGRSVRNTSIVICVLPQVMHLPYHLRPPARRNIHARLKEWQNCTHTARKSIYWWWPWQYIYELIWKMWRPMSTIYAQCTRGNQNWKQCLAARSLEKNWGQKANNMRKSWNKGPLWSLFPKLQIIGTATSINRDFTVDAETSEGLDSSSTQITNINKLRDIISSLQWNSCKSCQLLEEYIRLSQIDY